MNPNNTHVVGRAVGRGNPAPIALTFKGTELWMSRGRCVDHPTMVPDDWFEEEPEAEDAAVKECGRCPVQLECLRYRIENEQEHGVWGGAYPNRQAKYYVRRLRRLEKCRADEEGN